jgi:hypothetical protein
MAKLGFFDEFEAAFDFGSGGAEFYDVADFGTDAFDFGADAFDFGDAFNVGDFDYGDVSGDFFDTLNDSSVYDDTGVDLGTDETQFENQWGTDETQFENQWGTDETLGDELPGDEMPGADSGDSYETPDERVTPPRSGTPQTQTQTIPRQSSGGTSGGTSGGLPRINPPLTPGNISDIIRTFGAIAPKIIDLYNNNKNTELLDLLRKSGVTNPAGGVPAPIAKAVTPSNPIAKAVDAIKKLAEDNPLLIPGLLAAGALLLLSGDSGNDHKRSKRHAKRIQRQSRKFSKH